MSPSPEDDYAGFEGDMILKHQNTALITENDALAKENAAIAHEIAQTRGGAPPSRNRFPAAHVLDPMGIPLPLPLQESGAIHDMGPPMSTPMSPWDLHAAVASGGCDPPLDLMEAALYGPPPPPLPELPPLHPELVHKIVPPPPPPPVAPTGEELHGLASENARMAEDNKRMRDVLVANSVNPVAAACVHSEHLAEDNARLREHNARMHDQLMRRLV